MPPIRPSQLRRGVRKNLSSSSTGLKKEASSIPYIVALKTLDLIIFTLKYELFILTIFSFIIYPEKQPTNSNLTERVAD